MTVVRAGTVTGHSARGAALTSDLSCRLLVAFAELRCVPSKDARGALELLPVDHVADAILAISLDAAATGRTYNLAAARPLPLSKVCAMTSCLLVLPFQIFLGGCQRD